MKSRSEYIGSSDIAAIVGASRYRTPRDVYLAKTEGIVQEENEAMYWGKAHESSIVRKFMKDKGIGNYHVDVQADHPQYDFIAGTADALIEDAVVEAKTTRMYPDAWGGNVPDEYLIQCQWLMGLHGKSQCWFPVLFQGSEMRTFLVNFDKEFYEMLIKQAVNFWQEHVIKRMAPPLTTTDPDEILKRFDTGKVLEANSDIVNLVLKINDLKAQKSRVEEDLEELTSQLCLLSLDAERIEKDGIVLAKKTLTKSLKFDNKLLEDHLGKDWKSIKKIADQRANDDYEKAYIEVFGNDYKTVLMKEVPSYKLTTNYKKGS